MKKLLVAVANVVKSMNVANDLCYEIEIEQNNPIEDNAKLKSLMFVYFLNFYIFFQFNFDFL